ncbi:hypothetical protein CJ195_24540 [Bacillus sp. UMB0899]|uniref:hypothetical protein n=1 Tax=Metabacillus schmidteae TaxID=2730405 RepID=UPI000C806A07|nr:hypothetical protein [Metabacillus schmidteae]PMC34130.1 hypothetical protein CJ195_24540 [Bacillus sp. UMB0899]
MIISRRYYSVVALVLAVTFFTGSIKAFATTEEAHYEMMAKDLLEMYDENSIEGDPSEAIAEDENINSLFVNDMVEKQKQKVKFIENAIEQAEDNGEKLYSYDEILNAKAKDFGISQKDMSYIKKTIKNTVKEYEKLHKEFDKLGKKDHPLAVSIKESIDWKIPKSLIYVDHSSEDTDGRISGGGWPYCLDDNGWGYKNFINSDCQWAYFWWFFCVLDQSGSKMGVYSLRYCKTNIRNCSPLIFHSKYWHTH